ncbi:nucleotidyltransferase [Christensenella hongkongensis]|uniref:nucleotidyltransferase n=2 Tax=Christensenella hongkongensis TaxID=270498 RepID=UPI002671A3E2|nr:nucleotidyltransferase [Christensenella hongkongensis]
MKRDFMKIAGIIAEYNPFHMGHAHHISQTRQKTGADYIICVISGNFSQRGECMVYDKWTRAHSALLCGADLVLELPFLYATQSAEGFARGGVDVLNALGCIDYLSFGAENADTSALLDAAALLLEEPPEFSTALKEQLSCGVSFPSARAYALASFLPQHCESTFTGSNNILGIEYCKELLRIGSKISPFVLKREGNEYSSRMLSDTYSSATAVRAAILHGRDYRGHVPAKCLPLYQEACAVSPEAMFPHVIYALRMLGINGLREIAEVAEGLEHKISACAKDVQSYDGLIHAIKSKRYTYTRIQRILLYALFGVTKQALACAMEEPLYARVLGVRKKSMELLSLISRQTHIPLVTKAAEFPDGSLLHYDLLSSDIYGLFTKKIAPAGRDFTQKLMII